MEKKSSPDCKVMKAEFLYSVPRVAMMEQRGGEVVFIGRSNAGKSSLINALSRKKDLARVAKMPGRTRHAVVYQLIFSYDDKEKPLILVDLPGFGFASMSKSEAQECEALIFSYLRQRKVLELVVLLLDIRRELDERELEIIKIAKERNVEIVLVLTKFDKIVVSKRKPAINNIIKKAILDEDHVFIHSTTDEGSTENLRRFIVCKETFFKDEVGV